MRAITCWDSRKRIITGQRSPYPSTPPGKDGPRALQGICSIFRVSKWQQLTRVLSSVQFSSVAQSCPTLCNPWTAACQASLSISNSQSLLKLMSIESVMPSNHLILCCPLLLLPSIFPSIRVFSSESVLHIRWPKYWSFSFSISPSVLHIRWPKYWSFSFSISPSKEYVCINRQKKQLFTQLEKKEVLKFQHIYDTEK